MREVRACDFCGEGAAGVYEVLPEGIAGGASRMVLCEGCRETLSGVVDPLLAALDGGGTLDAGADAIVSQPPTDGSGDAVDADASDVVDADAGEGTDSTHGTGDTGESPQAPGSNAARAADDEEVHEAGGRPQRARRGTPKGYSKVMRFLEGREFPMERESAEEMVVEAYELDPDTVSAAIDHACKHGRLREASGKLFR